MRLTTTRKWPIECCETKTKVVTLSNHNKLWQHNKPIRTWRKYMYLASTAGKQAGGSHDWVWFSNWLRTWHEFWKQEQSMQGFSPDRRHRSSSRFKLCNLEQFRIAVTSLKVIRSCHALCYFRSSRVLWIHSCRCAPCLRVIWTRPTWLLIWSTAFIRYRAR